ncbi:MAG: hypothetical protein LKK54_06590, partial [Ancrocorticia sp.]|nr:hypothetical protein [Ancrocorticia sp.]
LVVGEALAVAEVDVAAEGDWLAEADRLVEGDPPNAVLHPLNAIAATKSANQPRVREATGLLHPLYR